MNFQKQIGYLKTNLWTIISWMVIIFWISLFIYPAKLCADVDAQRCPESHGDVGRRVAQVRSEREVGDGLPELAHQAQRTQAPQDVRGHRLVTSCCHTRRNAT